MECTHCGEQLEHEDYYFTGAGREMLGEILRCPNAEGFQGKEEVLNYLNIKEAQLEEYCKQNGYDSWEDIVCGSASHHVSGSFYTDKHGNLYEGYPC